MYRIAIHNAAMWNGRQGCVHSVIWWLTSIASVIMHDWSLVEGLVQALHPQDKY